jgi:hypothetical protein
VRGHTRERYGQRRMLKPWALEFTTLTAKPPKSVVTRMTLKCFKIQKILEVGLGVATGRLG